MRVLLDLVSVNGDRFHFAFYQDFHDSVFPNDDGVIAIRRKNTCKHVSSSLYWKMFF